MIDAMCELPSIFVIPRVSNPLRPSFSCLNLGKGNTRLHTSICLPIANHMTDADICASQDVNWLMSSLSRNHHH